jgi:hypothetical protein
MMVEKPGFSDLDECIGNRYGTGTTVSVAVYQYGLFFFVRSPSLQTPDM